MLYNHSVYSRAEIDAARPAVTMLGGWPHARCLSLSWSSWSGELTAVDYTEVYAWNHWDRFAGSYLERLTPC